MSDIVVVGSMNMDLVVRLDKIPNSGETIFGDEFHLIPGGKGANQAVAASRLGGDVSMIAKIGDDSFGQTLRQQLQDNSVNVDHVTKLPEVATGVAFITVEGKGENRIIVVSGANYQFFEEDLAKAARVLSKAKVVITQFEIPMPVVKRLIDISKQNGSVIVVNAAPVQQIPDEVLRKIDYLIVNEHEAQFLSGIEVVDVESAQKAARALVSRGGQCVIITLGPAGSLVCTPNEEHFMPDFDVSVVDTTAAGDAFIGGFAVSLLRPELSLFERISFGNAAGALATTKIGAQSSLPTLAEVEALIEKNKNN